MEKCHSRISVSKGSALNSGDGSDKSSFSSCINLFVLVLTDMVIFNFPKRNTNLVKNKESIKMSLNESNSLSRKETNHQHMTCSIFIKISFQEFIQLGTFLT